MELALPLIGAQLGHFQPSIEGVRVGVVTAAVGRDVVDAARYPDCVPMMRTETIFPPNAGVRVSVEAVAPLMDAPLASHWYRKAVPAVQFPGYARSAELTTVEPEIVGTAVVRHPRLAAAYALTTPVSPRATIAAAPSRCNERCTAPGTQPVLLMYTGLLR
jgi:hypothetical protein